MSHLYLADMQMNDLETFFRVAASNMKRIEADIRSGNEEHALQSLKMLIETLEVTQKKLNFCPSLLELEQKAQQLLKKISEKRATD
jgi:hypothetical protein